MNVSVKRLDTLVRTSRGQWVNFIHMDLGAARARCTRARTLRLTGFGPSKGSSAAGNRVCRRIIARVRSKHSFRSRRRGIAQKHHALSSTATILQPIVQTAAVGSCSPQFESETQKQGPMGRPISRQPPREAQKSVTTMTSSGRPWVMVRSTLA